MLEKQQSFKSTLSSQLSPTQRATLSNSKVIEVYPPEVIFKDIVIGNTYEMKVTVRNLSTKGRRIRFTPPKTPEFTAEYETLPKIAGGISTQINVVFNTIQPSNYHDTIRVLSDDFEYLLHLHAYLSGPSLVFDKFVNIGIVPVNQTASKEIVFFNEGSQEGEVNLKISKLCPDLKALPLNFFIPSGGSQKVKFTYHPTEAEVLREPVQVQVLQLETIEHIDVNATSVEHTVHVVSTVFDKDAHDSELLEGTNMAIINQLNMNLLYQGQIKEIQAFIFNNGPVQVPFNIKFIEGTEADALNDIFLTSTPQELAILELKRVMKVQPAQGVLEPYDKFPITFSCHSKIMNKEKGFYHNIMGEEGLNEMSQSEIEQAIINYMYTAIITFGKILDQKLTVKLQAQAVIPTVKVKKTSLFFPACFVNEKIEMSNKLMNLNEELPIDFMFEKATNFRISPYQGKIYPNQTKRISIVFKPNNRGKFHDIIQLSFVNHQYQVPIHLYGKCNGYKQKAKQNRGLETSLQDFQEEKKHISNKDLADTVYTTIQKKKYAKSFQPELTQEQIFQQTVRKTYVDFLRTSRKGRLEFEKQRILSKNKRKIPKTVEEIEMDPDLGMRSDLVKGAPLLLPTSKDGLFIKTSTGGIEGVALSRQFDPDRPHKNQMKKPIDRKKFQEVAFNTIPQTQIEYRECQQVLKPEELQYVNTGPRTIYFNDTVVFNPVQKWFTACNDLKQSIQVSLKSEMPEITEIQPSSLVLPPGQTGGFLLTFIGRKAQKVEGIVTYKINKVHEFNFKVTSRVELAQVQLSQTYLKFSFDDDSVEDSLKQIVTITNQCSAPVQYNWELPDQSNYQVEPLSDVVNQDDKKKATIIFTPNNVAKKGVEEILTLNVKNGEPMGLRCIGSFTEASCVFVQKQVNFDTVSVGVLCEKSVILKNNYRTSAVFSVKECPADIQVTPQKARLAGNARIALRVEFQSQHEKQLDDWIVVYIRGGKALRLKVTAEVIVPRCRILQEQLDFGGITCRTSSTLPLTLKNESTISAALFIDLDEFPEFQISVDPRYLKDGEFSNMVLVPANTIQNLSNKQENLEDDDLDAVDDESDLEIEDVCRKFRVEILPEHEIPLLLKFTPKLTDTYLFELPVSIVGIDDHIPELTRLVSGEGLQPRFLIEPPTLDFKRKFLAIGDKTFPEYKSVIFSNPDIYPVRWFIETKLMELRQTFYIRPVNGVIEPGQSQEISVSFNPQDPELYEETVNIFLDGSKEPYLQLYLIGEGATPRINFDKRQVILPITPLGIRAKAQLQIINEGYQNLELRYKLGKDPGQIPIRLNFPDGKVIGIPKPRIPVEITCTLNKPLSFTLRLEFIDQQGNKFPIDICGTFDNSLITNYPFIQRNLDQIQFKIQDDETIMLEYDDLSDDEYSGKWGKNSGGGASSVMSRSVRSILGYVPIPWHLLEREAQTITKWLNTQVLSCTITKFPDDIIQQYGMQLGEITSHICGRQSPKMVKNPYRFTPKELTFKLYEQYESLLNFLKKQGALLNTIRPEFLLGQQEFQRYLKLNPDKQQLTSKQVARRWPYLSLESWITLIYQMCKVFMLNRITPKQFKQLPGVPQSLAQITPDMTQSNFYSLSELIILKWLSYHFSKTYPEIARPVRNFDKDLTDGIVLAAVITSHIGPLKSLANLKINAVTNDQKLVNCEKVLNALSEINVPYTITAKDMINPDSREMLGVCFFLYQNLPSYIPRTDIEFACVLGQVCEKQIELSNPGTRPISYQPLLEGSKDYKLKAQDIISLEPLQSKQITVKFNSRVSIEQKAKLSFISAQQSGEAPAQALVFTLRSKVHSRVSLETFTIETSLYQPAVKEILVQNKQIEKAEYQIIIQPHHPYQTQGIKPVPYPPPFFIRNEKLMVKPKNVAYISIQFIPFLMQDYGADIVFIDELVGEVQYTILGKVKFPEIVELPVFKGELGNSIQIDIPIDGRNKQLEQAKTKLKERYASSNKLKEREILHKTFRTINQEEGNYYEVQISSPYFQGPKGITMLDKQRFSHGEESSVYGSDVQKQETIRGFSKMSRRRNSKQSIVVEGVSQLNLICNPRSVAHYVTDIILTSQLGFDIRAYRCTVHVKPRRSIVDMTITSEAYKETVQKIPIVNTSEKNWTARIQLKQSDRYFKAPTSVDVKKGKSIEIPLQFQPDWVCEVTAKLIIEIPQTEEVFEFNLRGIGEEPSATDHIVLKCKVKEMTEHLINVENRYGQAMTFRVETDIQGAQGESKLMVRPNSTGQYLLKIQPYQSGTYVGAITFYDSNNRFIWYTVEVNTIKPEPEETKQLICQCRKAVELKITVYNPAESKTQFDVFVNGAGLLGDSKFVIQAQSTRTYELLYSPLLPGRFKGSVRFISQYTGEFWYKLLLVATPPDDIILEDFESEIGQSSFQHITLENPTSYEVMITSQSTNDFNFEVIPQVIFIPPYEVTEIQFKYTASSVKDYERGTIQLRSKQLGDWTFMLTGRGLPPSELEPIEIAAAVGETNSIQIQFKNPFREQICVNVEFEGSPALQSLVKRKQFFLGPLNMLIMPIVYSPESMEEHHTVMVISANDILKWRYPLKGITEKTSTGIDYVFRIKCREAIERKIPIYLPDLTDMEMEEVFSHEVRVTEKQFEGNVEKSLSIEPLNTILLTAQDPLEFQFKFMPLKPFKTLVELLIYKASGGRWKFNLMLDALEPDVDDKIVIESSLNKTASAMFKLSNQFKIFAPFNAHFTDDSDQNFQVSPQQGYLEPSGREGTPIIVSYTSVEYGAPKRGKLVITTSDMMWSYVVIGKHPKYKAPDAKGGRLDNQLPSNLIANNEKKNYIRNNIHQVSPRLDSMVETRDFQSTDFKSRTSL